MKPLAIIGIILTLGLVVILKIFQVPIPKNNEPITNISVLVIMVIFAVIYVISIIRKK